MVKGRGVYSSHPMYLIRENSGNFHVVMFKTSVAMDINKAGNTLSARTVNLNFLNEIKIFFWKLKIGGIIRVKMFLGDKNPETAIKLYHKYLGGYIVPPFWYFLNVFST